MQIQQQNNEKVTDQSSDTTSKASEKVSEKVVQVKSFYNKHFPTDRKSYNLRIPFIGLILSVLSLHFVTTTFAVRFFFFELAHTDGDTIRYLYIFIAAALNYGLYYGLKIGDRKQFTPWIILKFIELIFILATIIYIFVEWADYLRYYVPGLIYGIVIFVLNSVLLYVVMSTSTAVNQSRARDPPRKADSDFEDNIYDTYDDV